MFRSFSRLLSVDVAYFFFRRALVFQGVVWGEVSRLDYCLGV